MRSLEMSSERFVFRYESWTAEEISICSQERVVTCANGGGCFMFASIATFNERVQTVEDA